MKKIIALALAAVMALSMVACGAKEETKTPDVDTTPLTAVEFLTAVLEEAPLETPDGAITIEAMEVDLADADATMYFTGVSDPAKLAEAAVAEPMIGSMPISFVVVKVAEGQNVEEIRDEMVSNIDMRKWICVAADSSVTMAWEDGFIAFAMMPTDMLDAETYKTAFETLKANPLSAEVFVATAEDVSEEIDDTEMPMDLPTDDVEPVEEIEAELEAEDAEEVNE